MNLDHMLAQLRGTPSNDLPQSVVLPQDRPRCAQRRCSHPVATKKNGECLTSTISFADDN